MDELIKEIKLHIEFEKELIKIVKKFIASSTPISKVRLYDTRIEALGLFDEWEKSFKNRLEKQNDE